MILSTSSRPEVLCEESAVKYLAKFTGKRSYRRLLKINLKEVGISVFLWDLRDSFFIEHLLTATSGLGKDLKNFTNNYDLAKFLTTLAIIIDFAENILNSGVAMKQSENPTNGMIQHSLGTFFPWKKFHKWVEFSKEAWEVWTESGVWLYWHPLWE